MQIVTMNSVLIIVFTVLFFCNYTICDFNISVHDVRLKLHENVTVNIYYDKIEDYNKTIILENQHNDIIQVIREFDITETSPYPFPIVITAVGAGHSEMYATVNDTTLDDVFVRATVYKVDGLDTFSTVIGWIYFVAWSVSFYPQIYINWRRKSVVGLNFDFIALNVVGFTLYSAFNLGLFYIPEIEDEYFARHPRGMNPVKVNDIFFAVHATAATIVTIIQCYFYEREDQRVSTTARSILGIFGLFISISIIISACNVIHWLDFLYYCSYVKLTITLIKYVPQAYMNYKRKSTIGWSIGNIFLDFTGGTLSMLQMIVDAYNYNDWVSIFGDPTKFGLGLFSVVFDIFFIVQHYILYRTSNYDVSK